MPNVLVDAILKKDPSYTPEKRLAEVKRILADENYDVNALVDAAGLERKVNALHLAVSNGYIEIVKALLAHPKIDPNVTTGFGRNPLHLAAIFGEVEICKLLLPVTSVFHKDRAKKYPLLIALDRINAAETPVEKEKFKNIIELIKGRTFFNACKNGDLELVKRLIESKVLDVNYQDHKRMSPLHYTPTEEVAEYLLNNNANINALDDQGNSPLLFAVISDRYDLVYLFLKRNADYNLKYKFGNQFYELLEVAKNEAIRALLSHYKKYGHIQGTIKANIPLSNSGLVKKPDHDDYSSPKTKAMSH